MKTVKKSICVLEDIRKKYDLSDTSLMEIKNHYENFRVFIPLVGKFSVGKSATINNIVGGELVYENITPETAIPTELICGDEDIVCICNNSKEKRFISFEKYREIEKGLNINNTKYVKLVIAKNDSLNRFPNVALVDMPGLDSGYEIHDIAIEDYISNSMAYTLVFSADELTVPKSMVPILNTLSSYNMPMCVILTKGERVKNFEDKAIETIKNNLRKYLNVSNLKVFIVENGINKYGIDDFLSFLEDIEKNAHMLGRDYYKNRLTPEFFTLKNYLQERLINLDLSLSELEDKKIELEEKIKNLDDKLKVEFNKLEKSVPDTVEKVVLNLEESLYREVDNFAKDVLNNVNPEEDINNIIRNSLNNSYAKDINNNLNKQFNSISKDLTNISSGSVNVGMNILDGVSKIGITAMSSIGYLIGTAIVGVGGPIGAICGALFSGVLNMIKPNDLDNRKNEVKNNIIQEKIPQILSAVSKTVENDIRNHINETYESFQKETKLQVEVLQSSLDEVIKQKEKEEIEKSNEREKIKSDIDLVNKVEEELFSK